jgi:hypothetical protein
VQLGPVGSLSHQNWLAVLSAEHANRLESIYGNHKHRDSNMPYDGPTSHPNSPISSSEDIADGGKWRLPFIASTCPLAEPYGVKFYMESNNKSTMNSVCEMRHYHNGPAKLARHSFVCRNWDIPVANTRSWAHCQVRAGEGHRGQCGG